MTYKIPYSPSPKAYKEEIADFWEIQAVRRPGQYVSKTNISRTLSVGLDEFKHEGIESEDDDLTSDLDGVLFELSRRRDFSSGKYPFSFTKYSLKLCEENTLYKDVYLYLLLCTRFNMRDSKVHNDIDGTLLFEKLCGEVAANYFGETSKSYVFGTANPGNFEEKIDNLIEKIGEGHAFKNPNNNAPTKNDDAVDVVAWRDFADERIGKLIAFGQCKTGTSWQDDIKKLNPKTFCDNWFSEQPILTPIPLVFISDTLCEQFNFSTVQRGRLVFNRFRILEYIEDDLSPDIHHKIKSWLDGAISTIEVSE